MSEESAPYPNKLRELRLAAFLTRLQLAAKTALLAEGEPNAYNAVSARSLERLERGETKPRIKTAAALSKVLERNPWDVFPLGPDNGIRNSAGNTVIPIGRKVRGKAKSTESKPQTKS